MRQRRSRRAARALVLVGLLSTYPAVVAPPAHAANLVVTSPNQGGAGSLSQAVALAAPGDTITFSSALNGVPIQAPEVGFPINKDLTIRGNGADFTIIHGMSSLTFQRVFDVASGTVLIDGLTITSAESGLAAAAIDRSIGPADLDGLYARLRREGVVDPAASVTLSRSRITGTRSGATGAVRNQGRATIRNTVIDSNQALTCAGVANTGVHRLTVIDSLIANNTAIDGLGGGICNTGDNSVDLLNTDVVGNHAIKPAGDNALGRGGGIAVPKGGVTMRDGAIRSNRVTSGGAGSSARGGGLYSEGDFAFLNGVEVSANDVVGAAQLLGGGVFHFGDFFVIDSTFTANSAGSGRGGAIYSAGSATLFNPTLAGNQAAEGSNIYNSFTTVTLTGTIMANSPSPMCAGPGSFDDDGHNISFPDATCPGAVVDPLLTALAFNGGPTQTMALQPGSPAIDAGPTCAPVDQRGFPRNVGPCDIGAYEFGATLNDVTAPACAISALRADNPRQMDVTVQDPSSGLNTVVPTLQQNAVVNVPYFQRGTRNPVVVTAAKVDQAQVARWAFEAADLAGNSRSCT
jgi:predicted outer membrane repeat protein